MAKFKNVSPLGALDIPFLAQGRVEAGEIFEVADADAQYFASANFKPIKEPHPTRDEKKESDR